MRCCLISHWMEKRERKRGMEINTTNQQPPAAVSYMCSFSHLNLSCLCCSCILRERERERKNRERERERISLFSHSNCVDDSGPGHGQDIWMLFSVKFISVYFEQHLLNLISDSVIHGTEIRCLWRPYHHIRTADVLCPAGGSYW